MDEIWFNREVNVAKMSVDERASMVEAKKKELTSWFANAVWEFAELDGTNSDRVVTARWVLTFKEPEPSGATPRAKARLVIRGFQDPDLFSLDKASPTATRQSKLLLLCICPNMTWTLYCGDVKTAFLSGAKFQRSIIVKLPADCGPLLGQGDRKPAYMKQLKSAYGLADAPLLWFQEASRRLRQGGWRPHFLDKCLFLKFDKQHNLIAALVSLKDGVISLSYADYISKVHPITVPKARKLDEKLTPSEVSRVRGLIGALQWPASQGMPALAASVSILASQVTTGDGHLMNELNKTLRFAKSIASHPLKFQRIAESLREVCLVSFFRCSSGREARPCFTGRLCHRDVQPQCSEGRPVRLQPCVLEVMQVGSCVPLQLGS